MGALCIGVSIAAAVVVARDPARQRILIDSALFAGLGEAAAGWTAEAGSCAPRGSGGSGGRSSSDLRYSECTLVLRHDDPETTLRQTIRLFGPTRTLEASALGAVERFAGELGMRPGAGLLAQRWMCHASELWVVPFVAALGLVLLRAALRLCVA